VLTFPSATMDLGQRRPPMSDR